MRCQRRAALFLCGPLLLGMGSGCASSRLEHNKQVVLSQARAYNERDIEGFRATLAPNLRRHCQATPDINVRSADEFVAFIRSDLQTYPDGRLVIDRLVAEGDLVGAFGRFIGTQDGPMGPIPASGKQMVLDFGGVFRIENDRVAQIWITWDNLAALTQLGHWPPSGDPGVQSGGTPHPDVRARHLRDMQAGNPVIRDDRAILNATESAWADAIHAGDRKRIFSYWTDDAVIYAAGGRVVEGKPAILGFVNASRDRGTTLRIWREPEKTVVAGSRDIGYTIGTYEFRRTTPDGADVRMSGRHLCTWRKEDGEWRCMLEIHSPN